MKLSKSLNIKPNEIAKQIVQNFKNTSVEKVEIAGPGFLNFFLLDKKIPELLENSNQKSFKKKRINVEFVSANPTGPLHLAHGRGLLLEMLYLIYTNILDTMLLENIM